MGLSDAAGRFFHKEMTMRRKLLPFWSIDQIWSKGADILCGYGERPMRVIGSSLLLILTCSLLYFLLGVSQGGGYLGLELNANFENNLFNWLDCVYYSVVTFTTLGYGDISPVGYTKIIAASEAFAGAFMMALFIVVFGNKMTR